MFGYSKGSLGKASATEQAAAYQKKGQTKE
jgi:hypothetical protein